MKKSIITALSILLTFLIATQTMSIAVFAIDDQSEKITDETAENAEPVNDLADMPDIVSEVESKRDACKKDFLLEDGSFCSVITSLPIHEYSNGKWREKNSINKSCSIKNVLDCIKNISAQKFEFRQVDSRNENTIEETNGLTVDWGNTTLETINGTDWHNLQTASVFYMKLSSVGTYVSNDYLITSAILSVDCRLLSDSSTISRLYPIILWNPGSMSINSQKLLSERSVTSNGSYTYNITDLFNKWEKGKENNYGIAFSVTNKKRLSVSNPCIVVRYIDTNSADLDLTFHSKDLSISGTVYINDVTNNFEVKQKLLDYSYNKTDLSVYRAYNSADANLNNYSGVKSSFNYESKLAVNNDYAEWTMFDGNSVRFVPSDPPVTNNGYEVWELLMTANSANLNAALYLPVPENTSPNRYVMIDGIKYLFRVDGSIDRITEISSNSVIMDFEYFDSEPEKIKQIGLPDGNKIVFSYDNDTNFVESVEIQNANDQTITINSELKKTELDFTSSNNQVINTVTFGNGDTSVYTFDSNGHLLSTINENGIRCEFEFAEYPDYSLGSYINGYELFNGNANASFESLTIDSDNSFKRVFTDINGKKETVYYNSDYRVVTYLGSDGKYKYLDYDETGLLNSYIFNNDGSEKIVENDFPELDLEPWISLDDEDYEYALQITGLAGSETAVKLGDSDDIISVTLYQEIVSEEDGPQIIFEADKTYVFGGKVYLNNVLPDLNREISITIETAPVVNGIPSTNYTEYEKIVFDNTLLLEWQYRLKAFKLEEDSVIKISLNTVEQSKFSYFTDITLFESQEAITDIDEMVTSLPIDYSYGNNGQIASESLTWDRATETDLTMSTAYSYNQNGKLREYEDFNGNPTYYQYDSNGILSGKGHSVDGLGNITDLNSLAYDAESVLTSTTQIIQNIENNNNVTLSTGYDEYRVSNNDFDITYVKIHHNGYDQVFKYDSEDGGMLTETYAESVSLPNDKTNYKTKYQYDANKDIVQIDYSNGYRDKFYEADYPDEYNYKCISRYSVDGVMETLVKTYTYQFDDDGNLLKSYDDSTNIMVDYTNNGYSLYEYDNTDPVLIFSDTKDTENTVRTYSNTYYDLQYPTSTPTDTVEISPSTISFNSDGIKTTTSSVDVKKNIGSYNATADYDMSSTEDYFGRLTNKAAYIEHDTRNNISGTLSLNEEYNYKDLGNGKTSGLVSEYTSTLTGSCTRPDENNNNVPTLFNINNTYSRKYEYDNRGNIKFVYTEENNLITPREFYEYDNANQVITEINFDNELSAHYTYDAGGNLTAKIYYKFLPNSFNIADRCITSFGQEIRRITYQYDQVWKDRMVYYSDTGFTDDNEDDSVYQAITYDKMGNPLNYVGTNNQGLPISGTLEWSGNLLTAFESDEIRIEYQYDRNGFRTQKIVYNKSELNNNTVYNVASVSDYIWDNGTLNGIIMSDIDSTTGHRKELLNVSFIYDESGSPIGYMSLLGIPYLFKKDIHDSVLSLVFPDGEEMFTYSYDSWGNVTTTYSENWSQDVIQFLIVYVMAALCPIAYHGYLYDYDTGMCFNKGRLYSPDWGRNINPEYYEKLLEKSENPLEANLYLFCNNNPLNISDKTASWYREYTGVEWKSNGFEVKMSDLFASRRMCTLFASQIIKTHGTWDVGIGYSYMGMSVDDIASDLFAHYVGKYAKAAINKVNAVWGDGWILKNSKSDVIFVYGDDPNLNKNSFDEYGKYYKIWIAAPEIKAFAQKDGIFITL